jgi:hypothetical protein
LKRAGFKFSAIKEAWYYHNGKYYKSTSEATSLDSIRDNYGITKDNRSPKQHYPVFSN